MTQKEELKRDLIAREIQALYAHMSARENELFELVNLLTGVGCPLPHEKFKAGCELRAFLHRIRESSEMLNRLQNEL